MNEESPQNTVAPVEGQEEIPSPSPKRSNNIYIYIYI